MKKRGFAFLVASASLNFLGFWLVIVARAYTVPVVAENPRIATSNTTVSRELKFIGEIGQGIWDAWDVAVQGNYAFVADDSAGLRVVDVSDPANPLEIYTHGPYSALGVAASGNYVYVAGGGKVRAYNISALPAASPAGSIDITFPTSVAVHDGHAYVTALAGLYILDLSDPASPAEVGLLSIPGGQLYEVFVTGNYAYMAETGPFGGFQGLRIADISNPANPQLVGSSADLDGTICEGVAVLGQYAYITTWDAGVHVIDVSDPTSPRKVGGINPAGTTRGIAVSEPLQMAFVASDPVAALDIWHPMTPSPVDTYDTPAFGRDLAVQGTYVYVADQFDGLSVLQFVQSVSESIPVAGGSLVSTFDNTVYDFPAGVFTDTVIVTHTLLLPEDVPPTIPYYLNANHFFESRASLVSTGQEAQPAPGKTFTIAISYDSSDIPLIDEENLALYRWNETKGQWSRDEITGTVDINNNQLFAEINHFSIFGMLEKKELNYRIFVPVVVKK